MQYINSWDYRYTGFEITIFQTANNDFIVDIKLPCGEVIKGWGGIKNLAQARIKAREFIKSKNKKVNKVYKKC